ncbi:8151_t:CDS:2 [Entrophospora sp. SA101]|nr:8151_t:CDS:2 [Entrophospora sp. SA101]CAJ0839428.1 14964_t:CDS:2 [Entrophospora sp. SA101]CAJ0846708.1 5367_t:CDS:2 [Entrophospora sp. SA101]CAJ0846716.1 5370_t:CDS:2 [Entrophospora sp. SA101]
MSILPDERDDYDNDKNEDYSKERKKDVITLYNSNSFVKSIEVVIPPEHKTGRGFKNLTKCPVKLFAEKHNLIIHEAPLKALFKDWRVPKPNDNLSSQFDIGVVVSFGYFLTPSILDSFLNGSINVHASLLPKYRGASPIQYAILNGDEETGVTVQELDYRIFDAGRIIRSIKIPIPFNSTYLILENILASKGAELLIDTLSNYNHYKRLASDQDASKISKAPKITKVMSEIKWNQMSSLQLDRLYRAISHQIGLMDIE